MHCRALIVRELSERIGHGAADRSLDDELRRQGVPGLRGVDTRALTRHLRDRGTLRGVIALASALTSEAQVELARRAPWVSDRDLVAEVSQTEPWVSWEEVLSPELERGVRQGGGLGRFRGTRIVTVDLGLKRNQLRALTSRGAEVVTVRHDADLDSVMRHRPQGVVLSNGPGDPSRLPGQVRLARQLLELGVPILGICLGHQVLGQAAGATTSRLGFGHHGGNHPVRDELSGAVYVTSQNHEFQVDAQTLPPESAWFVSERNLNDGSVEGLRHRSLPVISVQYHPEGAPGPQDRAQLFDEFLTLATAYGDGVAELCADGAGGPEAGASAERSTSPVPPSPPERPRCVLVIGSGPVIIGQAAEFDYAGTQACKALREEGIRVVLVNSNPATIMTDDQSADAVYIEPLTVPVVERIIAAERPDGLLATLGGQTGLNLAVALEDAGVLERYGVRPLGTSLEAIRTAEDRERFKELLQRIGEPAPESRTVDSLAGARRFLAEVGLPLVVRPAFTLGGTGGGLCCHRGAVRRGGGQRARRLPDRPGAGGALAGRLAGDRVRGDAGRGRDLHHDLQHGEPRSDGGAHRRLHRGGAGADPHRPRAPAAPQRGAAHHQRARDRRRLQRAVRPGTRRLRLSRHRGQPPGVAVLRPGQQGDRLPDRPAGRQDRRRPASRRDPQRGDRQDLRRLRAGPRLLRGQDPALAVRQVPRGRPAARDPDEVDRRGDGDRAELRGRLQQGAALARAAAPGGSRDPRPGAARQPQRPPHLRGHGGAARGGVGGGGQPPEHDLGVVRGPASGPGPGRGGVAARPRRRHPDLRQADGALRPADRRAGRRLPDRGGRCPPAARPHAHLQVRRHLRGRVRRGHALLLLHGRVRGRATGTGRRRRGGAGQRSDPDRPGHRVRLLQRPGRRGPAPAGGRRDHGQQQPGDGEHRLRLQHPPLLRTARPGGGARGHRGRAGERGRGPVRGPDRHQPRRAARPARGAHPRHHRRRHRPGRGPAPLRGADAPSRDPPAARGGHDRPRRGGRDRRPHRLPGARPPVVRAGREGDGGGPQSRSAPALRRRRDGRPPRGRRSGGRVPRHGAGRQVPLRHRDRRRRGVGRRDGGDPRADGARRAGRGPQRGLDGRLSGPRTGCRGDPADRGGHRRHRPGAPGARALQHPVRHLARLAPRPRGQPPGLPDGPVHQQGHRGADGRAGHPGDARRAARRPRIRHRAAAAAPTGRGQGPGVLDRQARPRRTRRSGRR